MNIKYEVRDMPVRQTCPGGGLNMRELRLMWGYS